MFLSVNAFNLIKIVPTEEQIANYLSKQRVAKAQRKQQRFTMLASNALPQ